MANPELKQADNPESADIVASAKELAALLLSASSVEEAQNLLSQLKKLSGSATTDKERTIISRAIALGKQVETQLTESAASQSLTEQRAQLQFALSAERDTLGSMLASKNMLFENERAYIQSIDPDKKRILIAIDENGNVQGQREISGQRLRDSSIIVAAYSDYDRLDDAAKREYNKLVYGNETGPRNEEERLRGEKRIREAVQDVEGNAATQARTPEQQRAALERAKAQQDSLKHADEMERRRDQAKNIPGMGPAMEQAAEEARKKSRGITFKYRLERNNDLMGTQQEVPKQQPAQAATPRTLASGVPTAGEIGQLAAPSFPVAANSSGRESVTNLA